MEEGRAAEILTRLWSLDAPVWERYWVPVFQTFAGVMLARADLRPGQRVLDVGCGTGLATLRALDAVGPGGMVVGVDRAPGMLRIAKKKIASRGARNVILKRLDTGKTRLPSESFDRVVSNCGIGSLGLPETLQNIHQALVPKGLLSFDDWYAPRIPLFSEYARLFQAYQRPEASGRLATYREAFRVMDRCESKYAGPEAILAALNDAGFREMDHETVDHEVPFGTLEDFLHGRLERAYAAAEVRAMGSEHAKEFRGALAKALSRFIRRGQLMISWEMHYYRAMRG